MPEHSVGVAAPAAPLLECRSITKRFGGVLALDRVDFSLQSGEVHGLVGSNGAGKSTLMKILAGALPEYGGEIRIDGERVQVATPLAARERGIAMVYQELSGIGQLSVAENLFLGRQPTARGGRIDWNAMNRQAREYLGDLQLEIDVRRRLDSYPLVVRQMVEIARGLHSGARVLILDEPTSALSPPEVRTLFALIRQLRDSGVAVIFISHFIEDVLEICDRVSILKDGRRLQTSSAADLEKHTVIHAMLGHALENEEAAYETGVTLPPRRQAPPVLHVENLSRAGEFSHVNFDVAPGECLGLYGFVGAGHQALVHALAGSIRPDGGRVVAGGKPLPPGDVHRAVRAGVALVAADRAITLVRQAPVFKNLTMSHLYAAIGDWLTKRRERSVCRPLLDRVGCRPPDPDLPAGKLSGGNQQKVVLAKWLLDDVRVLLLEEPTRGMDVGAKEEIMQLVGELKQAGTAVVLASTEPELLLAYADRILTFSRGRVTHEFTDGPADKAALMRYA